MAKREQAIEENMGLIAQAQASYELLMDDIRGYCQQALQLIDRLERETSDCRQLVQYNQTVLVRQEQELKDAKEAASKSTLHGIFYNLAVQQVQVSKGSKLPRNPAFLAYYERK